MKNRGSYIRSVIRHKRIVYFLTVLLIGIGIWGLLHINKDEFPTFSIKEGLVVGVYPGATAEQVEQQLTRPLEALLFSFSEIDRSSYSYSQDGMCWIYVILDCPTHKKNEVWSKIKLRLNAFKRNLPPSVLAVEVLDEFSAVSSVLIALESSDKGYNELKSYADELKQRLEKIPTLGNCQILGSQEEEIAVMADFEQLSSYGINGNTLFLNYQTATTALASGTLEQDNRRTPIYIENKIESEQAIAEKIIWSDPDGNILRLRDVATLERRYKKPSSLIEYNNRNALVLSIQMRPQNNIVAFGKAVDQVLTEFTNELPQSVQLAKITDQPQVVNTSIWSFLRDIVIAMMVVILVMLLLFPVRSALIASSGVPVCTAATLAVMYLIGIDLNTVTLAALIVVLGMIVDDAIITMDGYMDKLQQGMNRIEAACASAQELFVPMLLATMAISFMFFPTLFTISGYLGDFVKLFPWVILIALSSSLIYALTVVPSLEVRLISNRPHHQKAFSKAQQRFFNFLQQGYERLEQRCFRHPKWTIIIGLLTVLLGVMMFLQLNIQMMPMAVRNNFAVEIYLESNANLKQTQAVCDSLQNLLLKDPRITSVTAFIGTGSPRFHATYAPKPPAPNFAQLIVNTKTSKDTENILQAYEQEYEHLFPIAHIRFKQIDYQGVNAPIAITLHGADPQTMLPYAEKIKAKMLQMNNLLKWVNTDFDGILSGISVQLNSDEAARLGVNKSLVSLTLSGSVNGQPLATLWENDHKIPVNLYNRVVTQTDNYSLISNQPIPTTTGTMIPLRQVATIEPVCYPATIAHIGGERSMTIDADLLFGKSQPVAMKQIDRFIQTEILPELPPSINISYGGLSATNRQVGPEILTTFLYAVSILFFFLLLHFKKVSIALLTLTLSCLCLFGAAFGLWIFDLDFGMTSVLGLVSLIGIIVRNGIIMFEYAEELRFRKGFSVKEAAMEAGKRRMRPIFLTSCTTALGVLPMILSGDALWMPMGVVICFGTLFSILLIVLIMPVSYWQLYQPLEADSQ